MSRRPLLARHGGSRPIFDGCAARAERLGAAPFPKGKFPFLGFLATVYEHVAAHAHGRVK